MLCKRKIEGEFATLCRELIDNEVNFTVFSNKLDKFLNVCS